MRRKDNFGFVGVDDGVIATFATCQECGKRKLKLMGFHSAWQMDYYECQWCGEEYRYTTTSKKWKHLI